MSRLSHLPTGIETSGKPLKKSLKKILDNQARIISLVFGIMMGGQAQAQSPVPPARVVGPGQEHTQILEKGELPKQTIVLPGGIARDQKGNFTVSASVGNSAASASPAAKGGGQIVTFQGKEMPIFEVAQMVGKMSPEEKKKAIDGMDDKTGDIYEKYIEELGVITKKRNEGKLVNQQAIIEKERKIDNDLIKSYYQYVINIENGASGERALLIDIRNKDITPSDLKSRIDDLLKRKDVRLAGL